MRKFSLKRYLLLFFSLFTIHYSLFTGAILAAPGGPPNPQPCQNALETDKLTDNYVANENGEAPIIITETRSGKAGDDVSISGTQEFKVDFSKLEAIFASANSNYLEGKFQDPIHQSQNLTSLNSQDFNNYHGAGQKAAPIIMVDKLKVEYVDYVYKKPELPESVNKYTTFDGKDPKTIYDLVNAYQLPDLDSQTPNPTPPSYGGDTKIWGDGWGKYWEKIPTSYLEFYKGKIEFRLVYGKEMSDLFKEGKICLPFSLRPPIEFVMPEFFRTKSVSDQLNQVVVPCAAQSFRHGENNDACGSPSLTPKAENINNQESLVSKAIKTCIRTLTKTPKELMKKFRDTIQTSMKKLNPVKESFAAEEEESDLKCFKILTAGKEGVAPYCALPKDQLQPGDSCQNVLDAAKLDKDNPNVICTFKIRYSVDLIIADDNSDPESYYGWDGPCQKDGAKFECTTTIRIYPVFKIPFLAEIWNNTLYSDESEGAKGRGVGSRQETGRPGLYTAFTPSAIYSELFKNGEVPSKNLPGQVADSNVKGTTTSVFATDSADTKERFIGATDCNKFFVRDLALKPKALQESLGLDSQKCNLQAASLQQTVINPGGTGPGPGGTGPTCDGKYMPLDNPKGNFGDPNCDYSKSGLYDYLKDVLKLPIGNIDTVGSVEWWWNRIVPCESNYNPNSWLTGDPSIPFHAPDPNGAWGLYQIGSTGLANSKYDYGNVEWKLQSNNAVGLLGDNGPGYWQCSQ